MWHETQKLPKKIAEMQHQNGCFMLIKHFKSNFQNFDFFSGPACFKRKLAKKHVFYDFLTKKK